MSLPPNWATLQQPPPRNHGTPAIDALRSGSLREAAGKLLADAAIARGEVGRETYGSLLTSNNGRDPMVDALQELADAVVYLVQAIDEAPYETSERADLISAIYRLQHASNFITYAATGRVKRLAKAKGEGK